jgi:hypothetical protein
MADFSDGHRCAETKFDARCQLMAGHDHTRPHVAMIRRPGRPVGFAIWRRDAESSWERQVGPEQWAPTFPRVE